MKLTFKTINLKRKYPFTISGYTFTEEPAIYTRLEHDGVVGYGEASPGYYFDETLDTAMDFLSRLDLSQFNDPTDAKTILDYLHSFDKGFTSAKAAVDIALHDLVGKLLGKPCYKLFGAKPEGMPKTTLTIGMDTPEMIRKKVREASDFHLIKVKLGGDNDRVIVETIRSETDVPITVDANQGWTDRNKALDLVNWLHEHNTLFIEQAMPKDDWDGNAWLTEHSPLPTVGDEAVLSLEDVDKAKGVYDGVNIKMVKCGGIDQGSKIIEKSRKLGLKLMIGCMGESSVGILGAAAIAPLCDWVDLDSTWLLSNNPYQDPVLRDGRIILSDDPGLGLKSKK